MSDDYWARLGRMYRLSFDMSEPLSAAGRMLKSLDDAEREVVDLFHVTDELHAQLRRCEIRSKWPTA